MQGRIAFQIFKNALSTVIINRIEKMRGMGLAGEKDIWEKNDGEKYFPELRRDGSIFVPQGTIHRAYSKTAY